MRLLVFILCIVSADAAFLCTVSADAAFPDEKIDKNAVIFAAADVPKSTKELVKSWYSIGVDQNPSILLQVQLQIHQMILLGF